MELKGVEERTSTSEWSPGHGRFTTKDVSISEAGISSTKSPGLHIQCQLATVKELGRGACGVVYKAVHVPTLTVVAVKVMRMDDFIKVFLFKIGRRCKFMAKDSEVKWCVNCMRCTPIWYPCRKRTIMKIRK